MHTVQLTKLGIGPFLSGHEVAVLVVHEGVKFLARLMHHNVHSLQAKVIQVVAGQL